MGLPIWGPVSRPARETCFTKVFVETLTTLSTDDEKQADRNPLVHFIIRASNLLTHPSECKEINFARHFLSCYLHKCEEDDSKINLLALGRMRYS